MPTSDASGRPIPPPPARFSPGSTRISLARVTWKGDTRGDQRPEFRTPGNITARARRPLTTADYRRLMHAPAGR